MFLPNDGGSPSRTLWENVISRRNSCQRTSPALPVPTPARTERPSCVEIRHSVPIGNDYAATALVNLRQINYLLAVVEEGSFTRAAQRLSVAQPSLSQQVRALERELGGPLLERMPSGVQLTAAGRAFLPEARAAASHAARAAEAARTTLGAPGRQLELATVTSLAVGLLPGTRARWRRSHTDTAVYLHEFRHRRDLHEAVRGGLGDLGVGPRPAHWTGPIIRLGWEEFVI